MLFPKSIMIKISQEEFLFLRKNVIFQKSIMMGSTLQDFLTISSISG